MTGIRIFGLASLMLFLSCSNEVKFEKKGWMTIEDPIYPPSSREKMLGDLLENHKLIGLKYSQMEKLMGLPDGKDSNSAYYRIVVEYGSDIDPVYTKNLIFQFSKDSTIISTKVNNWKAR